MENFKKAVANKNTTIAAILFAIAAVGRGFGAYLDDDPTTIPDWQAVVDSIVLLAGSWGFLWARSAEKE